MPEDPALPLLRKTLERCLDAITATALTAGDRAGWPSWELDAGGEPVCMVGGRPSLYDGDAGMAWALAALARATDREDLAGLAMWAAHSMLHADEPGLLSGQAGIALAHHASGQSPGQLPDPSAFQGADLTGGLAGLLLAQVRMGRCGTPTVVAVDRLHEMATATPTGVCWPESNEPEGRPLCGMAHGNSGIALALAEAAAAHPPCAAKAAALAVQALRWESAWFSPIDGGWPDLRTEPPAHPALWCHGAAGIAAVRLRLLQLPAGLGLPADLLRAEAEAAVAACGTELQRELGSGGVPGGLTLCHGLGGPLEALVLASETWQVRAHLDAARQLAAAAVDMLDDDPLAWPAGVRAAGSTGLFVGVAGAALVLARLLDPGRLTSPALLLGRP